MYKLIIIGSGPAGLTSAIYASRAQIQPLVIDGLEPGGQLTTTTEIENWPGFPEGIEGPTLMDQIRQQALRFGTVFLNQEVKEVDFKERPFSVKTAEDDLKAHCIIIATGASPRLLGLESEKKLMGRGVSVCATCDGFFFKGKDVLVVGGGDTAMEEAIYLSNLASKVTVVHRRDELRAEKILQNRVFGIPNISFIWDSIVVDIKDTQNMSVTGAVIKNLKSGETSFHQCSGIFMALGHIPNTKLFQEQIELDPNGFVVVTNKTETSVKGVFAAGDVTDPIYKQAITASGMGCMAALDAERYLQEIQDNTQAEK